MLQGEGVWYRSSTQNSGLAFGILPNLSHAQVWSWSDGFISLQCLSAPQSAGRWVKSFSPNAQFHLKTSKLHMVFQGGVCVRCWTQPDSWSYKNQPQQQIKPTANEVLPMSSKHYSWLARKRCFVSKGRSGDWGLGMVVPGLSQGTAAVDETPPPSAGHTGDGAGLICVLLWAKWQYFSEENKFKMQSP